MDLFTQIVLGVGGSFMTIFALIVVPDGKIISSLLFKACPFCIGLLQLFCLAKLYL